MLDQYIKKSKDNSLNYKIKNKTVLFWSALVNADFI